MSERKKDAPVLQKLTLQGFKSFAEKTEFEFHPGITAIVGPNGSGKSNIVDAIKWVLGEQSAKSLRGKEMADVIFSGSDSRKSMGYAEVTLTFNNHNRFLPVETDLVHITRRVYRSGEGEYLTNRQPCRLRDIKEMLLGTGAGTRAYAMIEQGKVDVLLQASPIERRVIFEEAAGVSRFKVKKIEALRKLDRTEQNLVRLSDILDEVEKQLRSVKYQAAKAKRYQEYTGRLRALRLSLALEDYHGATTELETLEQRLQTLSDQVTQAGTRAQTMEAESSELDLALLELNDQLRLAEGDLADKRGQLTAADNTLTFERARLEQFGESAKQTLEQHQQLANRIRKLEETGRATGAELQQAQADSLSFQEQLAQLETEYERESTQCNGLRRQSETLKADILEQMRTGASVQNELVRLRSLSGSKHNEQQRLTGRTQSISQEREELLLASAHLTAEHQIHVDALADLQTQLSRHRRQRDDAHQQRDQLIRELGESRSQHSSVCGRLEVIADMEARQEGVNRGVKQVLEAAQAGTGGWPRVLGMVADLIETDSPHAAVIEAALMGMEQHLVVPSAGALSDGLEPRLAELKGRVRFLPLDRCRTTRPPLPATSDPATQTPFTCVADLVRTTAELQPLIEHLLGRTVLVSDVVQAIRLSADVFKGWRLVTPDGQLVDADGTLVLGPPHEASGLISRKTQLRELQAEGEQIAELIEQLEAQRQAVEAEIEQLTQTLAGLENQARTENETVQQLTRQLDQKQNDATRLGREVEVNELDIARLDEDLQSIEQEKLVHRAELESVQGRQQALEEQVDALETEVARREQHLREIASHVTRQKVDLAKMEERHQALRQQLARTQDDLHERVQARAGASAEMDRLGQQTRRCQANILNTESNIGQLYLEKEQIQSQVTELRNQCEGLREKLDQLHAAIQTAREFLHESEHAQHSAELEASEARFKLSALEDRMLEEFEVDLAERYQDYEPQELDRQVVETEITELRRKIAHMGNVNLDAIQQLEDLEERAGRLGGQQHDLTEAKRKLESIIERINHDTQRMFRETYESVRQHFQQLFRKLFGGGKADVILEDDENILDCGIEIIARPPGKEPRNISLLSGGEKTMTAVALLLAIFRHRPSPFCILDEVDAALDEANIDRFTQVLHEFLRISQFVIITHSKRTMTVANIMYGISMQESGVSNKVSVEFEDAHAETTGLAAEDDAEPEFELTEDLEAAAQAEAALESISTALDQVGDPKLMLSTEAEQTEDAEPAHAETTEPENEPMTEDDTALVAIAEPKTPVEEPVEV